MQVGSLQVLILPIWFDENCILIVSFQIAFE